MATSVLALGLAGMLGASAHAQDATETEVAPLEAPPAEPTCAEIEARGTQAALGGLWEQAYETLSAALERCSDRPSLVFNLAAVEAETGRLLDSLAHYERYLAAPGDGVEAFVAAARQAVGRVRARLARLELELVGLGRGDVVRLDANELSDEEIAAPILLDPGSYELVIVRRSAPSFQRTLELAEGERLWLVLELTATEVVLRTNEPAEEATVLESPWFWILSATALIAVGTTVTVLLLVDQRPEGFVGNAGQVRFD